MGKSFSGASDSKSDQKSSNRTTFPYEFVKGLNNTIGRPFSIDELFSLNPKSFGMGSKQSGGYGGTIGGLNAGTPQQSPQAPAPSDSLGFGGPSAGYSTGPRPEISGGRAPRLFTMGDVLGTGAVDARDADEVEKMFKNGNLDPNGFTLEELEQYTNPAPEVVDTTGMSKKEAKKAQKNAKKGAKKFGNPRIYGALQDQGEVEDAYTTNRFSKLGF